jgi:hypothetical protein
LKDTPFGEWLMEQWDRKDAVGELARWAKKEKGFHRNMRGDFHRFMRDRQASQAMMDVFWVARREYFEFVYEEERKRKG